jgi:hypothetical protein
VYRWRDDVLRSAGSAYMRLPLSLPEFSWTPKSGKNTQTACPNPPVLVCTTSHLDLKSPDQMVYRLVH